MAVWNKYAVLDGGFGTEVVRQGYSEVDSDPLWSSRFLLTNHTTVKNVHHGFLTAGADIIETNTYQASVAAFKEHLSLSDDEASDLIKSGAVLACEVRDQFWEKFEMKDTRSKPLVAGSCGPYAAYLHDGSEYTGVYVDHTSEDELMSWHRPRISALLQAGVDLIAFETVPAQKEAEAIVKVLQEFPMASAWISFSCKDGAHVNHGELLADAVSSILPSTQIIGVGINCTSPIYISSLLTHLRRILSDSHDDLRIIIYPNSGETWTSEKNWHKDENACKPLSEYVEEWVSLGAHWIGGCCRTFPKDIADIRKVLYSCTSEK